MQTTLQQAQPEDQQLLLLFMEEYYRFDQLPFDREKAGLALSRLIQDDSLGYVWLIRAGDKSAGYIALTLGYSLEYHGRDAFIDEFYLREAFRGQGIGGTVLTLVAAQAGRLGEGAAS